MLGKQNVAARHEEKKVKKNINNNKTK